MKYPAAIQFLYGLQMFGTNFGLERAEKLAVLAGNPQSQLRFIHVAGTNGKGSTCAMLESIYRAAGWRVGLFTSPHLVSFRERIQVNRQLISEAEVARLADELQASLKEFSSEENPTMFEVVTVMALKYFAAQQCDLVIWETGLGGRLDATNIVTPLVSVITNIALDHTQWLGDTLGKIATEKAGIIKAKIPVVTAVENPEALAVIATVAREKNAPLTRVVPQSVGGLTPPVALLGEHQKMNSALAVATVAALQAQLPVTEENIRQGLATVNWPGRLQRLQRGGQTFLLDGAHNVAGVEALRAALRGGSSSFNLFGDTLELPPSAPTFIIGLLSDKDWRPMCGTLAPLASKIFTVPVASERTADAHELAKTFRAANPGAEVVACKNLSTALAACKDEAFIVVTGSLYLIGEALELLGQSPAGAGERGLNEWSAPK